MEKNNQKGSQDDKVAAEKKKQDGHNGDTYTVSGVTYDTATGQPVKKDQPSGKVNLRA